MAQHAWQKYLAEFFGTFILVFIGTTSVVGAIRFNVNPLLVAPFAFALALLAGLYAFAEVSGGHFNPAVSLGLFLDKRLSSTHLVCYWAAQFLGGIAASLMLLLATTKHEVASTATVPSSNGTALVMEIVTTAIFVLVILQASKSGNYAPSALLAIPLTLLAIHFATIPFDGTSVNPARTFGPDLVGDKWTGIWVYFVGPLLGAVIAWVIHTVVVKGETDIKGAVAEI